MKEIIKTEIAIGIETGDTDHEAENAESVQDHVPKSEEIEKGVVRQKRIAVPGEENNLFTGMCHLQVSNILHLYR